MINIIKKKKASREERILSTALTAALGVIAVTGSILSKVFAATETQAALGFLTLAALVCIVAVWITMTITLRKL